MLCDRHSGMQRSSVDWASHLIQNAFHGMQKTQSDRSPPINMCRQAQLFSAVIKCMYASDPEHDQATW